MTKKEAIENIMNRVEEIKENSEYEYIGVRVQENEFTEGESLDNSFVWVDGEMTDEELPGTCAVKLEDAQLANGYLVSMWPSSEATAWNMVRILGKSS